MATLHGCNVRLLSYYWKLSAAIKKNMEGHCTFLSQSWAPNWESIITTLFCGCPYLHALLRKCQSNDKPFYFSQFKIFPTYFSFDIQFSLKEIRCSRLAFNFFYAFSTCEHLLPDLLPQQIFCLCCCWLPGAGMGQHPLTALGVVIEVLWAELGQRLVRHELWTTTAAEFS